MSSSPMAFVSITLIQGRAPEQKRALYRELTEAVHRTLGVPVEQVRIALDEVPPLHFATAGVVKTGPSKA